MGVSATDGGVAPGVSITGAASGIGAAPSGIGGVASGEGVMVSVIFILGYRIQRQCQVRLRGVFF